MTVPIFIVPFIRMDTQRNPARAKNGTLVSPLLTRARTCVFGTNKALSHRPKFKITNKMEMIMWDDRRWDGDGTRKLLGMGVSHG